MLLLVLEISFIPPGQFTTSHLLTTYSLNTGLNKESGPLPSLFPSLWLTAFSSFFHTSGGRDRRVQLPLVMAIPSWKQYIQLNLNILIIRSNQFLFEKRISSYLAFLTLQLALRLYFFKLEIGNSFLELPLILGSQLL